MVKKGRPMRIACIDDESGNLLIFRAMLMKINAAVDINIEVDTYCGFTDEFIDKINTYNILFLDWHIPLYNGRYIAEEVRVKDLDVHIWLNSACPENPEIVECCQKFGCMSLPKPISKETITAIIKQYMYTYKIKAVWKDTI